MPTTRSRSSLSSQNDADEAEREEQPAEQVEEATKAAHAEAPRSTRRSARHAKSSQEEYSSDHEPSQYETPASSRVRRTRQVAPAAPTAEESQQSAPLITPSNLVYEQQKLVIHGDGRMERKSVEAKAAATEQSAAGDAAASVPRQRRHRRKTLSSNSVAPEVTGPKIETSGSQVADSSQDAADAISPISTQQDEFPSQSEQAMDELTQNDSLPSEEKHPVTELAASTEAEADAANVASESVSGADISSTQPELVNPQKSLESAIAQEHEPGTTISGTESSGSDDATMGYAEHSESVISEASEQTQVPVSVDTDSNGADKHVDTLGDAAVESISVSEQDVVMSEAADAVSSTTDDSAMEDSPVQDQNNAVILGESVATEDAVVSLPIESEQSSDEPLAAASEASLIATESTLNDNQKYDMVVDSEQHDLPSSDTLVVDAAVSLPIESPTDQHIDNTDIVVLETRADVSSEAEKMQDSVPSADEPVAARDGTEPEVITAQLEVSVAVLKPEDRIEQMEVDSAEKEASSSAAPVPEFEAQEASNDVLISDERMPLARDDKVETLDKDVELQESNLEEQPAAGAFQEETTAELAASSESLVGADSASLLETQPENISEKQQPDEILEQQEQALIPEQEEHESEALGSPVSALDDLEEAGQQSREDYATATEVNQDQLDEVEDDIVEITEEEARELPPIQQPAFPLLAAEEPNQFEFGSTEQKDDDLFDFSDHIRPSDDMVVDQTGDVDAVASTHAPSTSDISPELRALLGEDPYGNGTFASPSEAQPDVGQGSMEQAVQVIQSAARAFIARHSIDIAIEKLAVERQQREEKELAEARFEAGIALLRHAFYSAVADYSRRRAATTISKHVLDFIQRKRFYSLAAEQVRMAHAARLIQRVWKLFRARKLAENTARQVKITGAQSRLKRLSSSLKDAVYNYAYRIFFGRREEDVAAPAPESGGAASGAIAGEDQEVTEPPFKKHKADLGASMIEDDVSSEWKQQSASFQVPQELQQQLQNAEAESTVIQQLQAQQAEPKTPRLTRYPSHARVYPSLAELLRQASPSARQQGTEASSTVKRVSIGGTSRPLSRAEEPAEQPVQKQIARSQYGSSLGGEQEQGVLDTSTEADSIFALFSPAKPRQSFLQRKNRVLPRSTQQEISHKSQHKPRLRTPMPKKSRRLVSEEELAERRAAAAATPSKTAGTKRSREDLNSSILSDVSITSSIGSVDTAPSDIFGESVEWHTPVVQPAAKRARLGWRDGYSQESNQTLAEFARPAERVWAEDDHNYRYRFSPHHSLPSQVPQDQFAAPWGQTLGSASAPSIVRLSMDTFPQKPPLPHSYRNYK